MSLMFSSQMLAGGGQIVMEKIEDLSPKAPRHVVPTVVDEYDHLVIKSDTTYLNARVVIRNSVVQVTHDGIMTLGRVPQFIYAPEKDKQSIEIYCADVSFYGEFDDN